MTMMIAALVGVIVWRLLGLNEHVFESIPGMGMAFLAPSSTMLLASKRIPARSFRGAVGRAIGIAALVILAQLPPRKGLPPRHARCTRCCSVVVH